MGSEMCIRDSSSTCNPSGTDWYRRHAEDKFSCITPCQGVYADVNYHKRQKRTENTKQRFEEVKIKYIDFWKNFTENLQFDREDKYYNPKIKYQNGKLINIRYSRVIERAANVRGHSRLFNASSKLILRIYFLLK